MVEEAGWLEDLLEDIGPQLGREHDEFLRALGQIRTQGARCKEITHKLLSFARKTDPNISEVDLNDMVREIADLLLQKSRYADVRIETDLSARLPLIAAPKSEVQQVILNLVNNAVDAIDSHQGVVTISTRYEHEKVLMTVADTGNGIPETMLSRIFDPFFTTKPVGQGTGLGLSICFGIVQKLGGDIKVSSRVGVGTTFSISLPALEEKAATDMVGEDMRTSPTNTGADNHTNRQEEKA